MSEYDNMWSRLSPKFETESLFFLTRPFTFFVILDGTTPTEATQNNIETLKLW